MAKPSIRRFCNVQPSDRADSAWHTGNRACKPARHSDNRLTNPAVPGIPATELTAPGIPATEHANPAIVWHSDKPPGFPLKALISIKNTPIQFFVLR